MPGRNKTIMNIKRKVNVNLDVYFNSFRNWMNKNLPVRIILRRVEILLTAMLRAELVFFKMCPSSQIIYKSTKFD